MSKQKTLFACGVTSRFKLPSGKEVEVKGTDVASVAETSKVGSRAHRCQHCDFVTVHEFEPALSVHLSMKHPEKRKIVLNLKIPAWAVLKFWGFSSLSVLRQSVLRDPTLLYKFSLELLHFVSFENSIGLTMHLKSKRSFNILNLRYLHGSVLAHPLMNLVNQSRTIPGSQVMRQGDRQHWGSLSHKPKQTCTQAHTRNTVRKRDKKKKRENQCYFEQVLLHVVSVEGRRGYL